MANHVGPNTSHRQGYKMASALPADSSEKLIALSSHRNDGLETAIATRDRSLQLTKGNHRLLLKKKCIFGLICHGFEEHNFKESSIIWKNKHSFSTIRLKREERYRHNMPLSPISSTQAPLSLMLGRKRSRQEPITRSLQLP